jgi:two-component system sensor kinase FixL
VPPFRNTKSDGFATKQPATAHDHASVGVAEVDSSSGRILETNARLCEILGYTREELNRKRMTGITAPPDRPRARMLLRRLRSGAISGYSIEKRLVHKNGRHVWARVTTLIPQRQTQRSYHLCIVEDITASKQLTGALHDSEERLHAIVNTAADAIITIDDAGTIESLNPAAERLFGYRSTEVLGVNVNCLMPEPFQSEHDGYLRNYLRTGKAKIIGIGREVTGMRKERTTFPMNLSVSEVRVGGRRLFTGIVHDLSGRRELERQILEAAANEQRRIGQDLHDSLCQDLVGMAFSIDHAQRALPADAKAARKTLSELSNGVRCAAGQARDLARGLNPVDLNSGLWSALDSLAAKVSQSFAVRCAFRWDRVARVRDETMATHLYRIAQEAVGNAIRHGNAKQIEISLAARGGTLMLAVADNGIGVPRKIVQGIKKGFAVGSPRGIRNNSHGIGMETMHFRARVIGGNFDVTARKGGGTVVSCTIRHEPVPSAAKPRGKPLRTK